MINVDIPGSEIVHLDHLVLDVNGTLAIDGELIPGIPALLQADLVVPDIKTALTILSKPKRLIASQRK